MLKHPEDLRAVLLHMAAASAGVPQHRARVISWFRAALALLEDEAPPRAIAMKPQHLHALSEISESLSMAAEHAAWLVREADAIKARPPAPRARRAHP